MELAPSTDSLTPTPREVMSSPSGGEEQEEAESGHMEPSPGSPSPVARRKRRGRGTAVEYIKYCEQAAVTSCQVNECILKRLDHLPEDGPAAFGKFITEHLRSLSPLRQSKVQGYLATVLESTFSPEGPELYHAMDSWRLHRRHDRGHSQGPASSALRAPAGQHQGNTSGQGGGFTDEGPSYQNV